ncbi:MAG: FAD-dependent oxidoreductase [Chloroflexota bacterium]
MHRQVNVAIVGGGPAGMAAAVVLGNAGVDAVLLDMYPQLGGHYFKQSPAEFAQTHKPADQRQHEFVDLRSQVDESGVDILYQTAIWGIFPDENGDGSGYTIRLQTPQPIKTVEAKVLLLAPGSYDRPMVFPGWHLPGVITPGGAQMLLKGHGILPGKRILVAGSGPLLLAAAAGLAEVGAEVVAVLDTASQWDGLRKMPRAFWGQTERIKDAWHYGSALLRKGVPMRFQHAIFRAIGETEVTGVAYGKIDASGKLLYETETVVEVDTICAALGFLPNLALTRHLGCEHVYDLAVDAFYPKHDDTFETSIPSVFVAGDVTGIGGKDMAKVQGQMCAHHVLARLGKQTAADTTRHIQTLEPERQKQARFLDMVHDRLLIRPGLLELVSDETMVCRCEMVQAGAVRSAIADGAQDLRSVKLRTRCGMGACQGRYCESTVGAIVAQETGVPRDAAGVSSIRPPIIPVLAEDILVSSA